MIWCRVKFRTVVIDEAAQALNPPPGFPLPAPRGHPWQATLPAAANHAVAGGAKLGVDITPIEKLLGRLPEVKLLNMQYRMNEQS